PSAAVAATSNNSTRRSGSCQSKCFLEKRFAMSCCSLPPTYGSRESLLLYLPMQRAGSCRNHLPLLCHAPASCSQPRLRQGHMHCQAALGQIALRDLAAVAADDRAREGKPQADSSGLPAARCLQTHEGVEH